jgi:hypothetical protein
MSMWHAEKWHQSLFTLHFLAQGYLSCLRASYTPLAKRNFDRCYQ